MSRLTSRCEQADWRFGEKCVPTSSPATTAAIRSGCRPLMIAVAMPASVAFCTASSFAIMPPTEKGPFLAANETLYPLDIANAPDNFPVAVEQTIHLREENKQIGSGQNRDVDGEPVVVAKFQFLNRDGIVLVDNRHNIPGREQTLERVLALLRRIWLSRSPWVSRSCATFSL